MYIEYVEYGIGYRLPDGRIQINKQLRKNARLHDQVIKHELEHDQTEKFTLHDLLHDMKSGNWELDKFILTHPKMWTGLLPIQKIDGRYYTNPTMSLAYIYIIGMGVLGTWTMLN